MMKENMGNTINNNNRKGSSNSDEPLYLAIGKLRRAHGVKGEILMDVVTDFPEKISHGRKVFIGENNLEFTIDKSRHHAKGLLLTFEGLYDRSSVEVYRNKIVYILRSEVSEELPEDTYYHHQIIGLSVITEEGERIGVLQDILETGANDVYIVKTEDDKELLLPSIKSVIKDIDLNTGSIIVELPEWL